MYRIIGIIALVGTLAGCNNPTAQQPTSKTFEGEYKVILQSGPFRGPLEIHYHDKSPVLDDSLVIRDASKLPWSRKEQVTNPIIDGKSATNIILIYSQPLGYTRLGQETVYRLEIWINGTLRKTRLVKIQDDTRSLVKAIIVKV